MPLHIQILRFFPLCACLTLLSSFILAAPAVQAADRDTASLERTVEYLEHDIAGYREQAEIHRRQAKQYKELAENAEREAQKARQAQDKQSWSESARQRRARAAELEAEAAEELQKAEQKEAELAEIRERITTLQRASQRHDTRQEQQDKDYRAARQRAQDQSVDTARPPVGTILGLWRYGPEDEPFALVQEDPEVEAFSHKLEAHTPRRVWKGNFNGDARAGSMVELTYSPTAEEMNPDVPEWARRKVEGKLEWKLKLDMAGTCGTPRLIAAFYPGEIKWKEDGEDDPDGAWVSGDGKARTVTLEKSIPDATYYTYGSPQLYIRLPGPDFDPNVNTVDGLVQSQRFFVDVILPPEIAEKQGETLEVTLKGLKGGDSTTLELRRGAARVGRSVRYTHTDPVTIADENVFVETDRDPPFLSMNYLLGIKGARLDLEVDNGEMVEVSYGDAVQRVPVYDSWVQRKIARHQDAIGRLRPFYNMVVQSATTTAKQKEEATQKLAMIRNYERIMDSDKIHDYIRYRVGEAYFAESGGLIHYTREDFLQRLEQRYGVSSLTPFERDGSKNRSGVFNGVVWTNRYEEMSIEELVVSARKDYRDIALDEIPKAIAFGLYSAVAGVSGAGDAVTLFTGTDIFGKRVQGWQRVMAGVGLVSSNLLTFTLPKVMTPPSFKSFSPGQLSGRALRAGARARLGEVRLQNAAAVARNVEAAMARMSPAQRASILPPESPDGPPALSETPIPCALAKRVTPTAEASGGTNAPPPHPGPIDVDYSAVKAENVPSTEVVDPGADPLLPPQEFGTCQCGSTMLALKEDMGTAVSEMLVFSILVKRGLITPGDGHMPLSKGYTDAQLVGFLEAMGAEVMVIPTEKTGQRLSLEEMDAWLQRGWHMRDVIKPPNRGGNTHAVELRQLPRNANGEIDEVVWYDSRYGKILKADACEYLNDLATKGYDTIFYRWKEGEPGDAASTGSEPSDSPQTSPQAARTSANPTPGPEEFSIYDNIHEVVEHLYPNGKDAPPLNVVRAEILEKLKNGATWQQPKEGGASFSPPGIGTLRAGGAAIRVKPGHEHFIEFVEASNGGGLVPRYWPSGKIGQGQMQTYIPTEHLQYVDIHHPQWTDF